MTHQPSLQIPYNSQQAIQSSTITMPLLVRPVKEEDLKDASEIYISAFGSTSRIHQVIYPNGATESVRATILKEFHTSFNDRFTTCYKVVDTENNDRMVAWIDWKTFEHDQPESDWNKVKQASNEEKNPDVNSDFFQFFFGKLANLKREYIKGQARVHVSILITHSDYHRKGCGKLLLDKCAEHADELQLPTFLEASPIGAQLYLREGYVPVEGAVAEVNMRPYGFEVIHKNVMMARPVGGKQK